MYVDFGDSNDNLIIMSIKYDTLSLPLLLIFFVYHSYINILFTYLFIFPSPQVAVRIRPLKSEEAEKGSYNIASNLGADVSVGKGEGAASQVAVHSSVFNANQFASMVLTFAE